MFPAFSVSRATALVDDVYHPFLLQQIDRATQRIWASISIINAQLYHDPQRSVRAVIDRLAYARWRNVDVRILVGSANVPGIFGANLTSALYMRERELDVRFFGSPQRRGMHGKVVIVDDAVAIVGSHNWTHQAFHRNVEASVAVVASDLVIQLAQQFETSWQHATEEPTHAS